MKIQNMRINGVRNPIGHNFDKVVCSWTVAEAISKYQIWTKIEFSKDPYFMDVIALVEGISLDCFETQVEIQLEPCTRYFWRVTVTGNEKEEAVSDAAFFETAKMQEAWMADWIGTRKEDAFHPLFRKSFEISKKITNARLYICGLGVYEAFINQEKIGNEYLAPFLTDYSNVIQYQTYEMTDFIKKQNEITIMLGNGWYMGRFGLEGKSHLYGGEMAAIAELRIEYEDGSLEVIKTDDTWQYQGSDIEASGIYDGEIWNRQLWSTTENSLKNVVLVDLPKDKLVERYSLPVIVKEDIQPVAIINTNAGETVLDMGQNFAGFMEFTGNFPKDTKVVLEFGEVLQNGNFYNDNYRSAKGGFTYISNGEAEVVRPHFTYFGFRYVKVTGWPGEVRKEDFTGKVIYSDLSRTGYLNTSNEKINRLFENCLWSQKSNFIDIPTDCPQRDERLGWTGDAQVFAQTASYNMDTRAFYHKYLKDIRMEQLKLHGAVPNYIPTLGENVGTASVWGDVATFLPAKMLLQYGNLADIDEYYPLMKDWVEYVHREDCKNGERNLYLSGFQFGDWLAQDGVTPNSFKGGTDDGFIASVYYYQSSKLLSDVAAALLEGYGKKEYKEKHESKIKMLTEDVSRYKKLAEKILKAIFEEYFTPTGRLSIDTQAAYIIALAFGVYPDKERVLKQFKERLKKDCYEIKCGFVGAPLLCTTLCQHGMEELAYHFLFKEEFPSWLYCVNLGATTIWERWNSLLEDGTISGTGMNSFNHYAYGSVVEFMYAYVAGLKPLKPGFTKASIAPVLNMKFRHVHCVYESVSGKYAIQWNIKEDGMVQVALEIPFNCSGEVMLPGYQEEKMVLEAGNYQFEYYPEKDYRFIYGINSTLESFARDEEAMNIIKEELPIAYGMIMSRDKENMARTLNELQYLSFMGFVKEDVIRTASKLEKLTRW